MRCSRASEFKMASGKENWSCAVREPCVCIAATTWSVNYVAFEEMFAVHSLTRSHTNKAHEENDGKEMKKKRKKEETAPMPIICFEYHCAREYFISFIGHDDGLCDATWHVNVSPLYMSVYIYIYRLLCSEEAVITNNCTLSYCAQHSARSHTLTGALLPAFCFCSMCWMCFVRGACIQFTSFEKWSRSRWSFKKFNDSRRRRDAEDEVEIISI